MTTTTYAAHDSVSVYALGPTPEGAISAARDAAKDPEAQFETARVSPELALWIETHGWDGARESFRVRDGVLTRTTRQSLTGPVRPPEQYPPTFDDLAGLLESGDHVYLGVLSKAGEAYVVINHIGPSWWRVEALVWTHDDAEGCSKWHGVYDRRLSTDDVTLVLWGWRAVRVARHGLTMGGRV